jgi:hypothetical protein
LFMCIYMWGGGGYGVIAYTQAAALGRRAAGAEAARAEAEAKEAAVRGELEVLRATMGQRLSDGAVRFAAVDAELRVLRQRGGEVGV